MSVSTRPPSVARTQTRSPNRPGVDALPGVAFVAAKQMPTIVSHEVATHVPGAGMSGSQSATGRPRSVPSRAAIGPP
jgi:hypothetical protein